MPTWRERAHSIINSLYRDGLVAGTPEEQRATLWRLYPWGEKAHHPYRAWLQAVRDRFPRLAREQLQAGDPSLRPLIGPPPTRRLAKAQLPAEGLSWSWLWAWRKVNGRVCGLCEGEGCLLCRELREEVERALSDDRLRAMIDAAETDCDRAMVADALAESGLERFANIWRSPT